MPETNYPYGHGGDQDRPGGGLPDHEPTPPGYGEAPFSPSPSGGAFGSIPPGTASGPSFDSAAPPTSPTSASSAAPAPWAASATSGPAAPTGAQGTQVSQGAQMLSAAQAGATLRKVGIGNPLPTFAVGALAYIVALGAALLVIISGILAALTADTGDLTGGGTVPTDGSTSPAGDGGWQAIVGLVGIPFQLVSLASFGSYDAELNLGFFGNAAMSLRGLPLLITVAMVATAFVVGRLVQRRWGSNGVLGALLWSGISGLAVAIFAVIATRVTALTIEDDTLGLSLSMHSAGVDMFFGTWVLIALPLFLGHVAGLEKPAWWPVIADLAAAPRLALVHALVFAVPVWILMAVVVSIGMVVQGDGGTVLSMFLAIPIWGLTGLALLPGLGMLTVPMHMNSRGAVEDFGGARGNEFLWFFELPWYLWIPLVLIALLMPAVVAVLWNRDRRIEKGNVLAQVVSWAALPLAYFGWSLILLALVRISLQMQMGMVGDLGMTVGLAPWMPVVAFFIGLMVEALARFGAPFVDRFVPGPLVNWFRRSARRRRADGTPGTGQTAPGQAAPGQAAPGQVPPMQGPPMQASSAQLPPAPRFPGA
ncbi:hypothetical protein [Brachybacterium sp. AOP3-A1-3]|uniref:hypothetical protein n=1 Tax=Brachybacterium sp. AOP3-A1-3 TaxID=3457699 RepID=UPI004033A5BB